MSIHLGRLSTYRQCFFFAMVRAGTAYRKIWRLVNNFFCSHNKVHCSEIPIVLSNLLSYHFFHWIMAHFNFVISQNAKWGHAGFYIDCHRMTVPENILLQKKHCLSLFYTLYCDKRYPLKWYSLREVWLSLFSKVTLPAWWIDEHFMLSCCLCYKFAGSCCG